VKATYPFWTIRLVGGILFFTGMLVMTWNMVMTMVGGRAVNDVPVLQPAAAH